LKSKKRLTIVSSKFAIRMFGKNPGVQRHDLVQGYLNIFDELKNCITGFNVTSIWHTIGIKPHGW